LTANLEAWRGMRNNLAAFENRGVRIPIIVQFNKQDLPNSLSPKVLQSLLQINGLPNFSAVAMRGEGVLDTLKAITRSVLAEAQRQMA